MLGLDNFLYHHCLDQPYLSLIFTFAIKQIWWLSKTMKYFYRIARPWKKNSCIRSNIKLIKLMLLYNNGNILYRVSGMRFYYYLWLWFIPVIKHIHDTQWLIIFDATLKFDAILMRIVFHCLSLCQYKSQM